ncbi:MAG: cysteine desulfurase [Clostridiales bacterium]|nr:cysteine desulfurase [Clostridiales bacterium]
MEHYLDNAATTRVIEPAVQKAVEMMTTKYANPSAQHSKGAEAAAELKLAKKRVLTALGDENGQLTFTSGGTESINTAILGVCRKYGRQNKKVVSTTIEHAATLETLKHLSDDGFTVVLVEPDKSGNICSEKVVEESRDACLVSIMAVNNETGAILPIKDVKKGLKAAKSPALLHVDGVQAFLKTDEPLSRFGADLLSVSGHKIGSLKGAGALYYTKGLKIPPLLYGGGQEDGVRSGTEALPAIAAMGEVCAFRIPKIEEELLHLKRLNSYLRQQLLSSGLPIAINSPEDASPHILNISMPGAKSEVLMRVLQQNDVFVSSGSACSRGHRSHVLRAMNLDPKRIDSAIRISFCPENTTLDIDALCEGLQEGAKLFF